jgi:hypothetical protein
MTAQSAPSGEDSAICLHWIMRTTIINSDRIQPLWNAIYELCASEIANLQTTRDHFLYSQLVLASIFNLVNHIWSQKKMRLDVISLFDKIVSMPDKTFTALINDIFNGVKLFLSMHLNSFIEFYRYKAILTVLNASIGLGEGAALLDSLVSKFSAMADAPGYERFDDLWLPLVVSTVHSCIRGAAQNVFARFRDMQRLLLFSPIKSQNSDMWQKVFETALFPALSSLSKEISDRRRQCPDMGERGLLMVKTVFKVFLTSFVYLSELSNFDRIWFMLMQCSFRLYDVGDTDLNEVIPELLGNALSVMKEAGVFENEARQRMWLESRALIQPLNPAFAATYKDQ